MTKKAKKQREFVFLFNGVPQNFILDEDALEEKPTLPPDAMEQLLTGRLRPGTIRRLRDELMSEAVRQDLTEAMKLLLPKTHRLDYEEFDELFQRSAESPDVRAWLLAYRREHYRAEEWEAWEQRRLDLELGFAEPTLSELKRVFKISFAPEGVCIGGVRKTEREYAIPAAVDGKAVVAVNAEAFYTLSPMPRISRRFAENGKALPELAGAKPGDTVLFGRRAEKKNAAEKPLPWRVLLRKEGRILVLCEECIATLPYHTELAEVTWENCTLRKWLNEIFLPLSFTPEERRRICKSIIFNPANRIYGTPGGADTKDCLFLPSEEELRLGLPEDALRTIRRWYWMRTPGFDNTFALAVTPDGTISKMGTFVDAEDYGVRPAMWLDTESGTGTPTGSAS